MNRRELLAFLSLGGASTASGCNGVLDGMLGGAANRSTDQPTSQRVSNQTTETSVGNETTTAGNLGTFESNVRRLRKSEPSSAPAFDFDYGQKAFNDIQDENFQTMRATGRPERNGDRLRITPGRITATELAARLRTVWGVKKTEEVTRTIGQASVIFAGGTAGRYSYLVGVLPAGATAGVKGQVLTARSASLGSAKELTEEFKE